MNARVLILALAAPVLAGVAYAGYRYGMNEGMRHASKPEASTSAAAGTGTTAATATSGAGRRILYWHDPMVPGRRFDKPGRSPFMAMDLVPVYADEGSADTGVAISEGAQQNLGVRTAEVVMGTLAPGIEATGSVGWNERDAAVVPARANGYVEKLLVRAPLDPVAQGQTLAELFVPDWVAAQEEFLLARRLAADGGMSRPGEADLRGLVEAARQRLRIAGMSEAQIARVEAGGVVQARFPVVAPIGGVLAEINVREGSAVTMGMPIARINGLSMVWINAELPEALAAQVRAGQAVAARFASGVTVQGKVGAVLPEINPVTRTLKVRIEVANSARQLSPGMFASLQFRPTARKGALVIPSEALIATGTRNIVMLAGDNGRFMPVEVEIGMEADGKVEITKGLTAGQRVVLSGQFLLDSEASLKGVETRQRAGSSSGAGNEVFRAEGRIVALGGAEVVLSHGPVPALKWGSMTMGFRAPRQGLPRHLAVGDTVMFDFRKAADDQYELTGITAVAPGPAKPSAGTRP